MIAGYDNVESNKVVGGAGEVDMKSASPHGLRKTSTVGSTAVRRPINIDRTGVNAPCYIYEVR
jgi:hypothetical protein